MPAWVTIVVGIGAGVLSGSVGAVVAAWINVSHDRKMRLKDLRTREYGNTVASIEEAWLGVRSVYELLRLREKTQEGGITSEQRLAAHAEANRIWAAAAGRRAPSKLLGTEKLREDLRTLDHLLACDLVPACRDGGAKERDFQKKLNKIHNQLMADMQEHLELTKWRRTWGAMKKHLQCDRRRFRDRRSRHGSRSRRTTGKNGET